MERRMVNHIIILLWWSDYEVLVKGIMGWGASILDIKNINSNLNQGAQSFTEGLKENRNNY